MRFDDVDQTDEMHAAVIEAVPARALRALAVALEIALAVVVEDVVLAGHVEDLSVLTLFSTCCSGVELARLREVRDVAGVKHERGRLAAAR